MDAFFRAVAIGLGVLMGTFSQGVEPELAVKLHKSQAQIFASAMLERSVSSKMEEALAEGVPMALTLQAEVEGRSVPGMSQVLTYLPLTQEWQLVRTGEEPRLLNSKAEAEKAWGSWSEVPLGAPPAGHFTVVVRVALSFPGRPDWKADLVWKNPVIVWTKSFTGLSEIPF